MSDANKKHAPLACLTQVKQVGRLHLAWTVRRRGRALASADFAKTWSLHGDCRRQEQEHLFAIWALLLQGLVDGVSNDRSANTRQ